MAPFVYGNSNYPSTSVMLVKYVNVTGSVIASFYRCRTPHRRPIYFYRRRPVDANQASGIIYTKTANHMCVDANSLYGCTCSPAFGPGKLGCGTPMKTTGLSTDDDLDPVSSPVVVNCRKIIPDPYSSVAIIPSVHRAWCE